MELNAQVNIHPERLTKKQALERTKEWAVKNIEIANSVPNGSFSIILLLTIIDSFAQAEYDYPPVNESSITFQKFVLNHTESQCKHLKKLCPVTMFYDYFPSSDIKELPLTIGRLYDYCDPELSAAAETILQRIPVEQRERAQKRHTYIALLYRLRSKLVHELNPLGTPVEFFSNVPSISYGTESCPQKDDGTREVIRQIWTLKFPRKYIYELTKEVIFHRIGACEKQGILPFPLLAEPRKCELSWYDK